MNRLGGVGIGFIASGLIQIPMLWNTEFLWFPVWWGMVGVVMIIIDKYRSSTLGEKMKDMQRFLHPEWMGGCALCRDCMRTVHDFVAPDDLWIEAWGNDGGILCYDCFCERLAQKGNYSVFELKLQEGMKRESYYRSSNKVKTE